MSQPFTSGGQNIGASALASVFPMNIQGWFPLALAGLTSLQSKRFSRIFSSTTICKHQFFGAFKKFQRTQLSLWSNSHLYMATGKTIALTIWTFVGKVVSLLLSMLSRFVMEKAMALHSSILAWKIPWMEEPGRLQSMRSWGVGHNWPISLSLFTFMHWRGKWQPTPVFLPRESQGWGSLLGCHLWGHTELDTIEVT